MRVGRRVPHLKPPLRAPFAFTSDGRVLLNVAELGDEPEIKALLRAVRLDVPLFVGIELTAAEVLTALRCLAHSHREAAAGLAGKRIWRAQRQR